MYRSLTGFTLVLFALLQLSGIACAAPLDDYYLQQFGEGKVGQLQKAQLSLSVDGQETARCGMPLKHALKRDWNLLEQTTQRVLAKQLASPTLANPATYTRSGGHFTIHYATTGADAPPQGDANGNGVPDWVETVAETFENVRASYSALGYQPAPTAGGAPYDVFLLDLAPQGYYGVTNSDQSASSTNYPNAVASWMELDNNFTDPIFRPSTYTPLQSLQITAAHEYHHAIQYGYSFFFDVWYAEATSTWMEDELYDSVNQLYSYIPAWFINSTESLYLAVRSDATASGAGYGRWIFNRYLAEKHGQAMIRNAWERVAGLSSPDGSDIPMTPVLEAVLSSTYGDSLGDIFFGFAKRVYTREWSTHTSDIDRIHLYSPVATFSAYPVNRNISSPTPAITLPGYSFAYYRFFPSSGLTSLTISINKSSGVKTAMFKNGSEINSATNGTSYTASNLGSTDDVVLLIANTSSQDGHSANFSSDGSLVAVTEPGASTSVPPLPIDGNGTGCFIATAAYGSYLHPHVQELRNFRDQQLLTNAPGRAFVALYYHLSPPAADFIARHAALRGLARLTLTPLVFAVAHSLIAAASLILLTGISLLLMLRLRKSIHARHLPTSPDRGEVY